MYAVVRTGGKQYRVEAGATLLVEKLVAEPGSLITLDRVLLVGDGEKVTVGTPTVSGASVSATVLGEELGQKIVVFKFKQKVKYRRRTGHRQHLTRLRVDAITAGGKTERAKVAEKPVAAAATAKPAEAPALGAEAPALRAEAPAVAAEAPAPAAEEPKPKRATRTRAKADRAAPGAPAQEAEAAEAKPARRSRAKAEVAKQAQTDASAPEEVADAAPRPKPRTRRTAKPKTESAKEE
jgi:large subunit ribosomal protein L21